MYGLVVVFLLLIDYLTVNHGQFLYCHDDPTFQPREGILTDLQFTWLGILQYIHVITGRPHYFKAPRVVLVSPQFVLSTAVDAANVPPQYALGNVVFTEYERDEDECKITMDELADGADCQPAVLLMPIADVLVHPEYSNFGAKNSVALLKLLASVTSKYMVPVCVPFMDYVLEDETFRLTLYHLDFLSTVPRDFTEEDREITILQKQPREICYLYDYPVNSTELVNNRMVCTTGCELRSGAPTIVREHSGHWTVVALAEGGSACPDPLVRRSRHPNPPRHILVHPYAQWITAAVTGMPQKDHTIDDPFGYVMHRQAIRAGPERTLRRTNKGWVGKWWQGGVRCYDRGLPSLELFCFYHETFEVDPLLNMINLTYYLEIDAPSYTEVVCVKVGVPLILGQPKVWGLYSAQVKVRWQEAMGKSETVVAALSRLDDEIANSERSHPAARLAVVTAELDIIQQEIKSFEDTISAMTNKETYAKTMHQLFVGLDLYRRPVLATENEDFVANVNRKEMRRLELAWLRARQTELQRERRVLHAQILRTRSLYAQLQQLLDRIWGNTVRPGTPLESKLTRASALRDALASVGAKLRAAAEYAHAATRMLDDALPAWKLTSVGKSGWERTAACTDACRLLVQARCLERGARRVLSAPAAPRAARALRLALDYAFTDAMHDHKYQRATEIFLQFKEALVQLITSIHQVCVETSSMSPT